jgi:hypothetical protein
MGSAELVNWVGPFGFQSKGGALLYKVKFITGFLQLHGALRPVYFFFLFHSHSYREIKGLKLKLYRPYQRVIKIRVVLGGQSGPRSNYSSRGGWQRINL